MDTKEFVQDTVGRSLTEYKTKYPPVPAEGFDGQVLMKNSDESGDFIWKSMMGSGWGVAKTGTFTMSGGPTDKVQTKVIDISDLEFAAASDYVVLISNTANSYDNVAITNKTASNFTVRTQYILSDTGSSNGIYGYVIMAKGYGQGNGIPDGGVAGDILVKQSSEDGATAWAAMQSTGWGIVKVVDVTFTNTTQRMYEATVSISELDVTSDDQWAVNFTIIDGDEDWGSVGSYTVEKDTPNKQATLKCQYLGVNSSSPKPTTLTAQVVVSADGYGTTLVKEGWGIARKRFIQIPNNGGEWGEATIDVSEYGFENADDYSVSLVVAGGAGGYGGVNTYIKDKTATGFVIHWARVSGGSATRVDFEYIIFGKGFGGGSGSGGTAMQHRVVGQEELIGDWTENGVTYDLYRKTIDCGALPNTTSKTVAHGIANKEKIVSISGVAVGSNNNLTIPFAALENQYNIYLGVGPSNITLTTGTDRSSYNAHITIEFTRARA